MADSSINSIQWFAPGHTNTVDLAVITVPWNSRELLLENIEYLFKSEGAMSAELIVVDNASQDGVVEAVRERFPNVRVIANKTNRGFSAANNQGIAVVNARHILLLNPDMRVEPDALQKTVEYLDAHPDVGVVGAKLIRPDGSIVPSVRRFPTCWSQFFVLSKIGRLLPSLLKHYLWHDFDYTKEQPVDSLRGSYFGIHRIARDQIGGLDERYFIWFEEVDYCKTVWSKGLKVMYVPTIQARDYVGRSFAKQPLFWKQFQLTRSMVKYFLKWM